MARKPPRLHDDDATADPRLEAMARVYVERMCGKDPDGIVRSGVEGQQSRWIGYVSNMRILLAAADAAPMTANQLVEYYSDMAARKKAMRNVA